MLQSPRSFARLAARWFWEGASSSLAVRGLFGVLKSYVGGESTVLGVDIGERMMARLLGVSMMGLLVDNRLVSLRKVPPILSGSV